VKASLRNRLSRLEEQPGAGERVAIAVHIETGGPDLLSFGDGTHEEVASGLDYLAEHPDSPIKLYVGISPFEIGMDKDTP
jgi:hypothetical protein